MPLLTVSEFYSKKLFELDDEVYKPIERAFCRLLGDKGGKTFLLRHMNMTVSQLSVNNVVDVMGCFRLLV